MSAVSAKTKTAPLGTSPTGGGFRQFIRRISHSGGTRPAVDHTPAIDELEAMGFPRSLATRQLQLSGGDPKKAAEYLVHAAHPKSSGAEAYSHPDCPVCVRELNNVRISEARRPSISGMLERARSRETHELDTQPTDARRGSVGAMLRRPSITAALARMTSRDIHN